MTEIEELFMRLSSLERLNQLARLVNLNAELRRVSKKITKSKELIDKIGDNQ